MENKPDSSLSVKDETQKSEASGGANNAAKALIIIALCAILMMTVLILIEAQEPAHDAGSGIALGMFLLFMWGPIILGVIPGWILLRFAYFRRFGTWAVMLGCFFISLLGILAYFFVF